VLDDFNGVLIDKFPPKEVAKEGKILDLWIDRHVKEFIID